VVAVALVAENHSERGRITDEVGRLSYVETAADHDFTAFMAGLTPGKVLKDRAAMFSKPEKKRDRYLRAKSKTELAEIRESEVYLALRMAREMRETNKKAS
jgi:hypothetical protein